VLDFLMSTMHASSVGMWHGLIVAVLILLPFPFYWYLWNFPDRWMRICGKGVNPSHRMAQVSHLLKALQIFALLSVATISRPPLICIALLAFGQYLNYRVYALLGEEGVYYGASFGKKLPWVENFPFGYFRDPQYVGSILSLIGCSFWVPWQFISLWIAGYIFMILVERRENPNSRITQIS
jgi:methylene-fatty-acyl-phospholipid synthase